MKNGAKSQTIFLTAVNALVRALGLCLRVLLSRSLGAEIMGIAELAQSVHMLFITPLTSGLPLAVSRITAKEKQANREKPLLAGIWLVRLCSALLIPALALLSPLLARLMGDPRVLPSLWFSAPCILILGYSAVYNGYCYGMERSRIPALSELIEQAARFIVCLALISLLPGLTAPWMAAVPVFATMVAEILGLCFVVAVIRVPLYNMGAAASWRKPILRLAAPATCTRLLTTVLRSLSAILIPARLRFSGLTTAEATARLGVFNGMVMPVLMLPCIFTSALTMVMLPKIARMEDDPRALRRILLQCLCACAPVAVLSWAAIDLGAPYLALKLYRMAETTELFRLSAPLALLFAFSHVVSGVVAALGQQKRSLYGAVPASILTLLATWTLAANPALRLKGVVYAQEIGQVLLILWNVWVLLWWRKGRRHSR